MAALAQAVLGAAPARLDALPPFRELLRDPSFLASLSRLRIADEAAERALTDLRRWIVLEAATVGPSAVADSDLHRLVCALVEPCFRSEYALFVEDDEAARLESVSAEVAAALGEDGAQLAALERRLALVALYRPLRELAGWERLLEPALSAWSEAFRPIVRQQVLDWRREREIERRIPVLTELGDDVSRAVRAQYEEHPYPRWTRLARPKPESIEQLYRRLRPGRAVPSFPRPTPVLVAGCGTGRHPIYRAWQLAESRVLAVDLSRASLAYGARMAEELGVANVSFAQADILNLPALGRRFAVVDCSGVLNCLNDPLAGWRALVDLLLPDGLLHIAVYSAAGRRACQVSQRFVAEGGFPRTSDGIRRLRRAILGLPPGHPARVVVRSPEFFSVSMVRDLLLPARELTFTLPQIAGSLEALGLELLAMNCPPAVLARFRAMFPSPAAEGDLACWDRFEAAYPGAFVGMYRFWCGPRA